MRVAVCGDRCWTGSRPLPTGSSPSTARYPSPDESRTPAPQTPAFAVPETRTVEGGPGRVLENDLVAARLAPCATSDRADGTDRGGRSAGTRLWPAGAAAVAASGRHRSAADVGRAHRSFIAALVRARA